MDTENLDLILNTNNEYNIHSFASNEEMSSDLQRRLKRINKLTDGLYETKFKIDRYKFDRALKNELADKNVLETLFHDIQAETNTHIVLWMKSKSNSKLRNPLVNVVGTLDGIERAKERVLSIFENIKTRVVLKMDVSYKDHSHIIGRGGFSIQRVMDDTGSHCHFPDSNRISEIKKSNVVLVCGSPCGVEQARCKIRSLLPLVVHFKIPIEHVKRSAFEQHSKHIRAIQQALNVHVSLRSSSEIDESHAAIFDSTKSSNYIAVSVRGQNNELAKLHQSLALIISRFTDNSGFEIVYTLTIEITEFYHQLVMGTNHANIRNIQQQTDCTIDFPVPVEANLRHLDFDNLNEIPVNKSTVIIKGPSFEAVHLAWKELIGCLPLVLTFDVPHDQQIDTALISQLKKHYEVAIFLKHKEKYNTVIIRGMEKNSRALFEVRQQLLKLDDSEIPVCCTNHGLTHLGSSKLFGHIDENGNSMHENTLNFLGGFGSNNNGQPNGLNATVNNLGLLNGNATNILNAKMMHNNIDPNNNPLNEKGYTNSFHTNGQSSDHPIPPNILRAALQEQTMLLQKQQQAMISRSKQPPFQPSMGQYGNAQSNPLHMLANVNMNDEASKLMRQQVGLVDHPSWRFTQSVSDISHLQAVNQMFQNDAPHQAIKKENLTSSCSSPALNQMMMQQNNSNSSMLNNYSMNNSHLSSAGNHTNNTSANSNAAASTANNSFSSNGLNGASPPANGNSSFNSSLVNANSSGTTTQSPIVSTTNPMNWPEQRRQNTYYDSRYLALKSTYDKQDTNEVRIPSSAWSGLGFSKSMSQDTLKGKLNDWNPIVSPPSQTSLNNFKSPANGESGLTLDDLKKHSNKALATIPDSSTDLAWPNMADYGPPAASKQRSLIKQESEICSSSHPYSSSYLNNLIGGEQSQFNSKVMQSPIGRATSQFSSINGDHLEPASFEIDKIDLDTVLREFGHAKFIDTFTQYKISFPQFLTLTEDDLSKLSIDFHNRRKLYQVILQFRRFLVPNYYEKAISAAPKRPDDLSATINKTLKPFPVSYMPSIAGQQSPSNELLLFDGTSSPLNNALTSGAAAAVAAKTSPDRKEDVEEERKSAVAAMSKAFASVKLDANQTGNDDGFEIVTTNDLPADEKPSAAAAAFNGSNDECANPTSVDASNQHDASAADQLPLAPSDQSSASGLVERSVPEVAQA